MQYGIDYKKALTEFYKILIAEPIGDNQKFWQKAKINKRNRELKSTLKNKIKKYEKRS